MSMLGPWLTQTSPEGRRHCKVSVAFRAFLCLTPSPLASVIFPLHPFTPRHARPHHRASSTCATPAAGQVLTPSHQRLCYSLWAPATHAALHKNGRATGKLREAGSHGPWWRCPTSSYFIISLTSILESSILCLLNPSSGVSLFVVALVFNSRLPSPLPPDNHICIQVVTVSRKVWRFTGVTASLCFPTVCSKILGQVWCFCCILLCFVSWFFKTLQRLCFKKINNYHRESKECVSGKMMLVPSLLDFPRLHLRKNNRNIYIYILPVTVSAAEIMKNNKKWKWAIWQNQSPWGFSSKEQNGKHRTKARAVPTISRVGSREVLNCRINEPGSVTQVVAMQSKTPEGTQKRDACDQTVESEILKTENRKEDH